MGWQRRRRAVAGTGPREPMPPAEGSPHRHETSPELQGLAGAGLAFPLPHSWGVLMLGVRKVAKSVSGMFMVEPPKLRPGCILQAMWA